MTEYFLETLSIYILAFFLVKKNMSIYDKTRALTKYLHLINFFFFGKKNTSIYDKTRALAKCLHLIKFNNNCRHLGTC